MGDDRIEINPARGGQLQDLAQHPPRIQADLDRLGRHLARQPAALELVDVAARKEHGASTVAVAFELAVAFDERQPRAPAAEPERLDHCGEFVDCASDHSNQEWHVTR